MTQAISTCSVILEDGTKCDGITGVPGTARGYCSKHYNRWRRTGDPLQTSCIVGDDVTRFWSKVDKRGPDECWLWTGTLDECGYGVIGITTDGRLRMMHATRWLLGHLRGEPLAPGTTGEVACHHCDNPPCVNPVHLYVGTMLQNMGDASQRRRMHNQNVTHCPQGHPYDEENTLILRGGKKRRCRICNRAATHKAQVSKTHCANGHELVGDNLLIVKNGKRKCATCEAKRAAEAAERMKVLWAERRAAREAAESA